MLIALREKERIEAEFAQKGNEYFCPGCNSGVILKKGRIKIPHFSHQPQSICLFSKGESSHHYQAKNAFRDLYRKRELRAETEFIVQTLPNDRRADIMVWSQKSEQVAIELQDSPIDCSQIEARTNGYFAAGIPVIWLPFARTEHWERMEHLTSNKFTIQKYPARPFEKWIHGYNHGEIWFYEAVRQKIWKGKLAAQEIYVEQTEWYDESGQENYGGGYNRISRRWKELSLEGPYDLEQIKIKRFKRSVASFHIYNYPAGMGAKFTV